MKRARGDPLTGGTGDVSPQWFSLSDLTLSAANTFTEQSTGIPVQRLSQKKGKSLVMEVLQVHFNQPDWDSNPAAGGNVATASIELTTRSLNAFDSSNPSVIAYSQRAWRGAFTAAGSYFSTNTDPEIINTNDGAGHGILVATDNIFLSGNTTNFAGAAVFRCRIMYRWKEVSLEEYIGIVQSQQ